MVIVAALTGSNTLRRISFVPCSCDDQNYVIPVINNSIHGESDGVCGQYLLTGNLKHFCSDVNNLRLFKKREDEDQTRASNCCLQLQEWWSMDSALTDLGCVYKLTELIFNYFTALLFVNIIILYIFVYSCSS